jgi:hypothetical protein
MFCSTTQFYFQKWKNSFKIKIVNFDTNLTNKITHPAAPIKFLTDNSYTYKGRKSYLKKTEGKQACQYMSI